MDGSGNVTSIGLNDPAPRPVQFNPAPTVTPPSTKATPTPKPIPKVAPPPPKKPVIEEPEVIPGLPTPPPVEKPVVTPPGTIAPNNRNRVNYDTPDISRAIRRNHLARKRICSKEYSVTS